VRLIAGAVCIFAGIATALWAQHGIAHGLKANEALTRYGFAVLLFLAGVSQAADVPLVGGGSVKARRGPGRAPSPVALLIEAIHPAKLLAPPALGIHVPLFIGALALGALSYATNGGNRFSAIGAIAWLGSLAAAVIAGWDRDARRGKRPLLDVRQWRFSAPDGFSIRVTWAAALLTLIILVATFLLYYRIAEIPREMTSDHAEKWVDTNVVLSGRYQIFFPGNGGREAAQFYLNALMSNLTGDSYLTLKLVTTTVGVLTVPFGFLFVRALGGTPMALLVSAFMAVSRWRLGLARVGLRYTFTPAVGAVLLFLFFKALITRNRRYFLLSGLVLGLSQYTFTSFRLMPAALFGCCAILLISDVLRRAPVQRIRNLIADTALMGVVSLLGAIPLIRYSIDDPTGFGRRGTTRIFGDPGMAAPPNLVDAFINNTKNAFLMYNWHGDVGWAYNIPNTPVLDEITGGLFVLGCAYGLYRVVRRGDPLFLCLFCTLLVTLLPSILALAFPNENPHVGRAGIGLPIAYVFVAIPVIASLVPLVRLLGAPLTMAIALVGGVALVLPAAYLNLDQYFRIYPPQHARSSQHTARVGDVVNAFFASGGRREDVHILPGPHWIDTRLVAIETGSSTWNPIMPNVNDAVKQDGVPRSRLFILHPDDRASRETLQRWYPAAVAQDHVLAEAGAKPYFVTVVIPPNSTAAT
jgi:hypothetical protein